jgi:hypothetical protein
MSVDANQIATKGDLNNLVQRIEQLLQAQAATSSTADEYLTLQEVAGLTRTSVKTVTKWVTEGKPDSRGKIIRLFNVEFSPGQRRIPRAALLAYGQSIGFSINDLKSVPQMRVMREAS